MKKLAQWNCFSSKSVLFHVSHGPEGCLDGDIWGYKRLKFSKISTAFGGGNHYTFINGFWATARGPYGEYCPPYHLSYLSLNAQHMLLFAKKKISISKESGWILKVSKFSKYCIYAPKWYFIRACSICMYSHDIFRGFCKAMWFILLAFTFWKWYKNGNSEGPNVCQAQLNICLGRALSI